MNKITKQIKWLSTTFIVLITSAEFSARYILKLGNPVLYETSPVYGYRPQPNQNIQRFGNRRIFYNAEGLRSETILANPAPRIVRVLCIGDSITYGGTQTDQAETYPYQLQEILSRQGSTVEVLNASAGGWAIENEEAYLRQEGIYSSKIVVLQLGSHDLFQSKSSSKIVGHSVSFPDRKPLFALEEGFYRYFIPIFLPGLQLSEPNLQVAQTEKDIKRNIDSFVRINNFVKSMRAQLIVIMIEQPDEFEPKNSLATFSKKTIANKAREVNIPYKNLREDFRLAGGNKLFRDGLHPNPEGNDVMAKAVAKLIQSSLKTSNGSKSFLNTQNAKSLIDTLHAHGVQK